MTWVKLDDQFDENLKVLGLSDSGFRLYVTLLCYCARKETDGRFSLAIAKSFGSPRSIKELVSAGLWLEAGVGLEVKDYLSYNPSHAQLEAERARVRGRVGLHRGRKSNTGCNGVTPAGGTSGGSDGPGSRLQAGLDPSGISDSVPSQSDPDPAVSFRRRREPGARPLPRDVLLGVRIEARLYVPLDEHWDYGAELGLTRQESERAAADVRDKFGGKRHDETWLDERLCSFLEQAAKSKFAPRAAQGRLTPADERTQRQLERVAELRAQEAAEEAQKAGAA